MSKFSIESRELWPTGVFGTIIFGISSAICFWRTSMEFHLMSQTFQYNELNVIKIGFYISLTLNSFFELIYSLSLVIENSYVKYGYTSHILALLAIVVAFSTSIYQWCSILFRSHERKKYIFLLKIFLGINVICSMISVGVLYYAGSVVEFAENNNWAYVLFSAVNAYSLFFLTVSLLVYGRVLAKRFIVDSRDATFRRKYQSLLRINAILGICCFCFFTRVMCLGIAISDSQGTDIEEEYFRPIWWFLLNSWIPTIPAWTLLYTWRSKRPLTDQRAVYGSDAKPIGSLALSSADDLHSPLHPSDILSDHESQGSNSYPPAGTASSDFGEEKETMNREDSAYEAYLMHARNLFDERLSAGDD